MEESYVSCIKLFIQSEHEKCIESSIELLNTISQESSTVHSSLCLGHASLFDNERIRRYFTSNDISTKDIPDIKSDETINKSPSCICIRTSILLLQAIDKLKNPWQQQFYECSVVEAISRVYGSSNQWPISVVSIYLLLLVEASDRKLKMITWWQSTKPDDITENLSLFIKAAIYSKSFSREDLLDWLNDSKYIQYISSDQKNMINQMLESRYAKKQRNNSAEKGSNSLKSVNLTCIEYILNIYQRTLAFLEHKAQEVSQQSSFFLSSMHLQKIRKAIHYLEWLFRKFPQIFSVPIILAILISLRRLKGKNYAESHLVTRD